MFYCDAVLSEVSLVLSCNVSQDALLNGQDHVFLAEDLALLNTIDRIVLVSPDPQLPDLIYRNLVIGHPESHFAVMDYLREAIQSLFHDY